MCVVLYTCTCDPFYLFVDLSVYPCAVYFFVLFVSTFLILNVSLFVQLTLEDPNMFGTFFQCRSKGNPCHKTSDRCPVTEAELLMNTVLAGHDECAEALIKTGLDVNLRMSDSKTSVINVAAKYGNYNVLKLLIQAGADVNLTDRYGETALMFAAANNNDHCIDMLIQAGADVKKRSSTGSDALMKAVGISYWKVLNAHRSDLVKEAFVTAIAEGHTDRVLQIIQSGADVNVKEFGPKYMHEAISSANISCVQIFMEAGVDVNNDVNTWNSVLLSAVSSGKRVSGRMISLLLRHRAPVNHRKERGQIALDYYISERQSWFSC